MNVPKLGDKFTYSLYLEMRSKFELASHCSWVGVAAVGTIIVFIVDEGTCEMTKAKKKYYSTPLT